jgi:dihydroflavonol-4-reductase
VTVKALVLGATGMIGGNVARALAEAGIAVRGLKRPGSPTWHLQDLPIEWVTGDLMDPSSLASALEGCRFLFHAAAYYPRHSQNLRGHLRRAVGGLRNVLSAAIRARVEKLVFTSSLTTIGPPGDPERPANERNRYLPGSTDSAYFEVKYAMEMEVLGAAAAGLPAVVVNPTVVLGPGDVKPTTGALLVAVARGQVPIWLPATVNVVDVRDAAAAQVAALARGRVGERYILGGHNVSVKRALTLAATLAGVRPPRWSASLRTVGLLVGLAEGLGRLPLISPPPLEHAKTMAHWQPLSAEKARRELALEPRPLEETFRDGLAWFRAHGYLNG